VANRAPWPVEANVTLNFPQAGRMTPFPASPEVLPGALQMPGQHVWTVMVQPYDAVAMRCDVPQVTVAHLKTRADASATTRLAAELKDLRSRNLNDQRMYPVLKNPSFEVTEGTAAIDGWRIYSSTPAGAVALDTAAPHAGTASLRLQSAGGTVSATSAPFANPGTGQLALTTFIKVQGIEPTTEFRIVFLSDRYGYRQYTTVDGEQLTAATADLTWRNLVFGVDDLPLDSRGQIQVRFELTGPGQVWIDKVGLHDLLFPHDNFYAESSQQKLALVRRISAAEAALAEDRLLDCWKIVDEYWMQFVQQHLPLVAAPAEVAENESLPDRASAPPAAKAPSLGERVKQYVPGFLR
jgi:hypothetical protein